MKFLCALLTTVCSVSSYTDKYFSTDFSSDFSTDFPLDFHLDGEYSYSYSYDYSFSFSYDYDSFPYDDMIWSSGTDYTPVPTSTDIPCDETTLPTPSPSDETFTDRSIPIFSNTPSPSGTHDVYTLSPTPHGYDDTSFPSSSPSSSPTSSPTAGREEFTFSPTSFSRMSPSEPLSVQHTSMGFNISPMLFYMGVPIIVLFLQLAIF